MTDELEAIAELGGAAAAEMVAAALANHGAGAVKCPNCGAPVIGPYCAACGQERDTHRRSVHELLRELLGEIASFDSRILRTAFALVARPGELSVAFREGRARRYVPALRLYLFVSLIFFLTLSATGLALMQFTLVAKPEKIVTNAKGESFAVTQDDSDPLPIPAWKAKEPGPHYSVSTETHLFSPVGAYRNALPAAARLKLERDRLHAQAGSTGSKTANWIRFHVTRAAQVLEDNPAAINAPLTEWIPRLLFVLLPLFALLMAAFYWRQRRNFFFVDHLVFSLNMHSFVFVTVLAAAGLAQILSGETVGWLVILAVGIYGLLAMKRFYGQNWFWTVTKFVAVSFVYTTFFLLPALATAIVVSMLGL